MNKTPLVERISKNITKELSAYSNEQLPSSTDLNLSQQRSKSTTFKKDKRPKKEVIEEQDEGQNQHQAGSTACTCSICQANRKIQVALNLKEKVDIVKLYKAQGGRYSRRGSVQRSVHSRHSRRSSYLEGRSQAGLETAAPQSNQIESKTFYWLMQRLCAPNDKIEGCPLIFPETAFFDPKGRVAEIIKTDKDGFITTIKQENRLILQEVRRHFSLIVRERRKEQAADAFPGSQEDPLPNPNLLKDTSSNSKRERANGSISYQMNISLGQLEDDEEDDKRSSLKDAAILRDLDGSVNVANENEFINQFRRRANDPFWKGLECIQTCIKSKIGLGRHYFLPFRVQISGSEHLEEDISYNFQEIGQEYAEEVEEIAERELKYLTPSETHKEIEERLRRHKPRDFCQRMCLKVGYYVKLICKVELLQMDVDFYQDENGKIWFYYAKNIVVRPVKKNALQLLQESKLKAYQNKIAVNQQQAQSVTHSATHKRQSVCSAKENSTNRDMQNNKTNGIPAKNFKEDEDQQRKNELLNPSTQYKLEGIMGRLYDDIKSRVQPEKAMESSETDEESKEVMKALRPQNTFKFKQLLIREGNKKEKLFKKISPVKPYATFSKDATTLDVSLMKHQVIASPSKSPLKICGNSRQPLTFDTHNSNTYGQLALYQPIASKNNLAVGGREPPRQNEDYSQHLSGDHPYQSSVSSTIQQPRHQISLQHQEGRNVINNSSSIRIQRAQTSCSNRKPNISFADSSFNEKSHSGIRRGPFEQQCRTQSQLGIKESHPGFHNLIRTLDIRFNATKTSKAKLASQKDLSSLSTGGDIYSARQSSLPSCQIRKLYQPPVRGAIFPSKNPFYNGAIVDFTKGEDGKASTQKLSTSNPLNAVSKNQKLEKIVRARVNYLKFATGQIIQNLNSSQNNWQEGPFQDAPYKQAFNQSCVNNSSSRCRSLFL